MSGDFREPAGQAAEYEGPVWAKVVSNIDPTYMGGLEVQILREVGNDDDVSGQVIPVKYLSPFFGSTSRKFVTDTEDYNNTQKSFGMWMVPPEVGSIVVCIFINGDYRKGYWIGCVLEENMNFSVPGHAATKFKVDGLEERVPVAEYNKVVRGSTQDPTKILKVESPLSQVLKDQGLLKDDIRGITTSSARRESPSQVFGISTPGPVDKSSGAKKGVIGKAEHQVPNAFVSRLGGSSFVMDDGDDKFLRKESPADGPPEYAGVELNETDGDVKRPHNELVRIRTRTGHQILLHNSEDLIYISNSRGTAWVELTSDGKIDIFSQDSISVHTKQDLNFFAERDINFECIRNLNIKVGNEMHTHTMGDQILIVDGKQKIHVKQEVDKTYELTYKQHVKKNVEKLFDENLKVTVLENTDLNTTGHNWFTAGATTEIKSTGNHIETAAQIHMNGPGASTAAKASEAELPQRLKLHTMIDQTEEEIGNSILRRIPTFEPYHQHENLDPLKVKPEKTDRDIDGRYEDTDAEQLNDQKDFSVTMKDPAEKWKTYTTTVDTFEKVKG